LLGAWGEADPAARKNMDSDDAVGVNDLFLMLGAWGPS
jgi:hypothetical protein